MVKTSKRTRDPDAKLTKAVILAGGLGTRLRPYTLFVPKPMLPLGDRPVLEHIIEWLKKFGIGEIVISVGYLKKIIEDHFQDGSDLDVRISYSRSSRPMGTAGQLKAAEGLLDRSFVCVYGDSLFDFDLQATIDFHRKRKATATMAVMEYKTLLRYGFIDLNGEGRVEGWREKPEIKGLINIGCYVMERKFLDYIPAGVMCGMDIAFRNALSAREPIYGYPVQGDFIDIGDRKAYDAAQEKYLSKLGTIL